MKTRPAYPQSALSPACIGSGTQPQIGPPQAVDFTEQRRVTSLPGNGGVPVPAIGAVAVFMPTAGILVFVDFADGAGKHT
jgi:hypothetical protein